MKVNVDPQLLPFLYRIIAAIAVLIIVAGVLSFKLANTTVDPTHPEKASSVVTTGVFAYSRNPMYVGFVLILLAIAIKMQNLSGYILVIIFIRYLHYFQILPEEKMLRKLFGQQYIDYCSDVRRWL